jgi:hypothetical protein
MKEGLARLFAETIALVVVPYFRAMLATNSPLCTTWTTLEAWLGGVVEAAAPGTFSLCPTQMKLGFLSPFRLAR